MKEQLNYELNRIVGLYEKVIESDELVVFILKISSTVSFSAPRILRGADKVDSLCLCKSQ